MDTVIETKPARVSVLVWPALWAASIFATSSGVVTTGQLSHAVSTVAGGRISESGFIHFWGVVWWIFVKGWHATEFAILYLLARKALANSPKWAFPLVSLAAFLDETHQLFVPSRGSRLSDVLIDCLGVLGAWVLVERGRFRVGKAVSLPFERKWFLPTVAIVLLTFIFVLSIYPFGLVSLHPSIGGLLNP